MKAKNQGASMFPRLVPLAVLTACGLATLGVVAAQAQTAAPPPNPTPSPAASPAPNPAFGRENPPGIGPATIPGKPIETRPPERADNNPAFPQQTRAPYAKSVDYQVTVVTDKLKNPWSLVFLPDGRYLVTERENPSAIRIVSRDGVVSSPLTGLDGLAAPGKLGLLEVALDPHFGKTERVFFTFFERFEKGYSNTFVGRAVLDEGALALKNVVVLLRTKPEAPVENFSTKQGGRIVFAKDRTMFVTTGDRDTGEPWKVAQELDNHLGKILHIDRDGKPARDNPFIGKAGALPEIWAYGFRTNQGLATDPKTGLLWESDQGPRGGDELNIIRKGANYGWPIITYGINYSGKVVGEGLTAKEGMEQPVYFWDPVIATSDLAFYTGSLFPEWKDSVFVTGLRSQMLTRLKIKDNKVVEEEALLVDQKSRIRDVRVGPDGALYALAEPNKLLRITPKRN
jgi:aldose sugar dehydrogenase